MADPFSMVFDALWQLAEASAPLNDLVRVGNRIKFNDATNRDPRKTAVQAGDLPELVLVCENGTGNISASSCSTSVTRRYSWVIATGDLRISHLLHPVEWALVCAMTNWKSVLLNLTWQGNKFAKRMQFLDQSVGFSKPEQNRNISGWSSVWGIEVEMHFTTADMIAFNS